MRYNSFPEYFLDGCCYDLKHLLSSIRHFSDAATTREFLRVRMTAALHQTSPIKELPVVGHECLWALTAALPLVDLASPNQLEAMIEFIKTSI